MNQTDTLKFLKKYSFKHPIEYSKHGILTNDVRDDLEMNDDSSNNILNNILANDNNTTYQHSLLLTKWSSLYSLDKEYLKDNQKVLKKYQHHKNKMDNFINQYVSFKNQQNFLSKYQYIQFKRFRHLNTIASFLQCLALYNFCTPLFSLLTPVFGLIIPYFILYIKGLKLGFRQYLTIIQRIVKNQYFIKGILNFTNNTLQNNLYLLTSIFFYFLSIYNNIVSCFQFYKNTEFMIEFVESYNNFINDGEALIEHVYKLTRKRKTFSNFNDCMMNHKKNISVIRNELSVICNCQEKYAKYGTIGTLLKCNFNIYHEKSYDDTIGFLVYLNNYNHDMFNISKQLNTTMNLCSFNSNIVKPRMKNSYYLPHINDEDRVSNNISMDKNTMITGPNASGKTTFIKSTIINLFLSQSLGCGCYESCKMKLYDYYHSYLNIPDTSNRDSLFQAEARRCKDIITFIEKNKNKTHFCIFDEIYSGTNPNDAVLCANIYLNGMNKYKNSVDYVLTTHYIDLCEKFQDNQYTENKKMNVKESASGFNYTYKLQDGISYVNGGYQILQQLDYPEYLLNLHQ